MTLKVDIDEKLAERVRQIADSRGMSLDRLVQDYFEDLAIQELSPEVSVEKDIEEFRRLSGLGDSQEWKLSRKEIHERSVEEWIEEFDRLTADHTRSDSASGTNDAPLTVRTNSPPVKSSSGSDSRIATCSGNAWSP